MRLLALTTILVASCFGFGQSHVDSQSLAGAIDAPSQSVTKPAEQPPPGTIIDYAAPSHRFWDRKNILLFSGFAVFRGLDYASTRNFERRGRQEVLIADDIVNNSAGFASLEAAGAATSVGISYLFHRTGHHKMERWLSAGHISVTAL